MGFGFGYFHCSLNKSHDQLNSAGDLLELNYNDGLSQTCIFANFT